MTLLLNKRNRHVHQLVNKFQHLREMPELLHIFLTELLKSEKRSVSRSENLTRVLESYATDLLHGVSRGEITISNHFLLGFGIRDIAGLFDQIM